MSRKRTKVWLTAWVLTFLMGSSVFAQGVPDMALFAPADLSTFGGGPRPREGLFFNFDWLYMGVGSPSVTSIGDRALGVSGVTVFTGPSTDESYIEKNSADTSFLKSVFGGGQRLEIGNISEHHGWLLGGFFLQPLEQSMITRDAHVLFKDTLAESGTGFLEGLVDTNGAFKVDGHYPRLPTVFNYLRANSKVTPWGIELNYLYRTHPTHFGSTFEFLVGARYVDFRDTFSVHALDAPPINPALTSSAGSGGGGVVSSGEPTTGGYDDVPPAPLPTSDRPNILADSYWNTTVDNAMIGPQIGLRHFQTWGRWTLVSEARFCAALNSQNYQQNGMIGSNLDYISGDVNAPLNSSPQSFTSSAHRYEFSPITECRIEALLEVTKAISLGAGWTGMYMGNVARASRSIKYEAPLMGINLDDNQEGVFTNGVTLKLIINR